MSHFQGKFMSTSSSIIDGHDASDSYSNPGGYSRSTSVRFYSLLLYTMTKLDSIENTQ